MITLSAILLIAAAGTISPGQQVGVEGLQGLGETRHHTVESDVLEKRLHVLVGLPDGYDGSGEVTYPTVYILDGGELYPLLRSYSKYLYNGGEAPKLMIVARQTHPIRPLPRRPVRAVHRTDAAGPVLGSYREQPGTAPESATIPVHAAR